MTTGALFFDGFDRFEQPQSRTPELEANGNESISGYGSSTVLQGSSLPEHLLYSRIFLYNGLPESLVVLLKLVTLLFRPSDLTK